MVMRVFEVHVEGWRISDACPGQTSFASPELHATLVVRVEDPHAFSSPLKALDGAS
jgi:hypothetical protein